MTPTSAIAARIKPGAPISSAKPVLGKAVDVGMIVCVEFAIWVKAAPKVTVAGLAVAVNVDVASAITGVLVGGTVLVIAVAMAVCVSACERAAWVTPAWIVTCC